jgi:hypothetical protein
MLVSNYEDNCLLSCYPTKDDHRSEPSAETAVAQQWLQASELIVVTFFLQIEINAKNLDSY